MFLTYILVVSVQLTVKKRQTILRWFEVQAWHLLMHGKRHMKVKSEIQRRCEQKLLYNRNNEMIK